MINIYIARKNPTNFNWYPFTSQNCITKLFTGFFMISDIATYVKNNFNYFKYICIYKYRNSGKCEKFIIIIVTLGIFFLYIRRCCNKNAADIPNQNSSFGHPIRFISQVRLGSFGQRKLKLTQINLGHVIPNQPSPVGIIPQI